MNIFGIHLWLFRGLSIGLYSPLFWIFHIPLFCTGYLIRDTAKSRLAKRIWLSIFAVAILLGEISCTYWLQSYDRLILIILLTMVLDLIIGYFSRDFLKPIRALIDWINKNEE